MTDISRDVIEAIAVGIEDNLSPDEIAGNVFVVLSNRGRTYEHGANDEWERCLLIAERHAKATCEGLTSQTAAMRLGAASIAEAIKLGPVMNLKFERE